MITLNDFLKTVVKLNQDDDFLVWGEERISSRQFSTTVRAYEMLLSKAGVLPGEIVAVSEFGDWRWLAAMFTAWRLGGVYAPDPENDLSCHWRFDLASVPARIERDPTAGSALTLPQQAAYLIPTSGTTGQPKRVIGSLAGLQNFVEWESSALGVSTTDVVTQLTAPTFDPVFRDVLVSFLNGAILAIPRPRDRTIDPRQLLPWMASVGASIVHVVPSIARTWYRAVPHVAVPTLRHVLLAGERLFWSDVRALRHRFGMGPCIHNLYGPSETTMAAFAFACRSGGDDLEGDVPVGQPIAGYAAVVLSESNQVCANFETGEIIIRARYPSLGYLLSSSTLNAPFIENPLAAEDPIKVYRTGDLGFFDDAAQLFVRGRLDDQFKVRGIRLSVGTIEDSIRQINGVCETAVQVWEDGDKPASIVAYVVSTRPLAEIKSDARLAIAQYALPNAWVAVDSLPRTASGKVERKNLARPTPSPPLDSRNASSSALVERLSTIWGASLPLTESVSLHDSFHSLGGKSIEAVQIVLSIEEEFGISLDLDTFYELQTLENVAAYLQRNFEGSISVGSLRLFPNRTIDCVQLTGAQQRFWDWMKVAPDQTCFQFIFAAHLKGAIDFKRLSGAMSGLLANNLAFALRFEEMHDSVHQVRFQPHAQCVEVDLSGLPASVRIAAAESSVRTLCSRPYEFGKDPLFRPAIVRLASDEAILVFDNHILASDGWTKRLLIKQLNAAYAGRPPKAQDFHFLDGALREFEDRPRWSTYLSFWRERFSALRRLNIVWKESSGSDSSLSSINLPLPPHLTAAIVNRSASLRGSVDTIFLAALARSLGEWTEGSEGHFLISNAKRLDPRLNEIVGCFTDSMLLGYQVHSDPTEQIRSMQSECGACLRNSAPSFEYLLGTLRPDIDPFSPSWFPVIFAPQADYGSLLNLPGVQVSSLPWSHNRCLWPIEVYPRIDNQADMHLIINFCAELVDGDRVKHLATIFLRQLEMLSQQ